MDKTIAVIVAHPDDEVLGCGGTLARLAGEGYAVHVLFMADGESSRADCGQQIDTAKLELRNNAAQIACKILGCASVEVLGLPDNRLDCVAQLEIINHIDTFVRLHRPGTVITHHAGDLNIDHCVVHEAVIAACRPWLGQVVKELFFFEVPSSTEWQPPGWTEQFNPNYFMEISATLGIKLEALLAYKGELREFPHPRSLKAIEALACWRGATVGVEAAEAFVLGRKIVCGKIGR